MDVSLVSIIITARDYARFLPQAIESALNQSFPKDQIELIVVDDGSVDETQEVVHKFKGHINYQYQHNRGQGGALNTGFKVARGKFIALLDADDYFYRTKIEEVVSKFNEDSRIGMVYHRMDVVDTRGNFIYTTPFRARLDEGWLRDKLIRYGGTWNAFVSVATSGLAFRRCELERILPIPEDIFRLCADGYLVTGISLYAYIAAIHKSLSIFRLHGNNYWAGSTLSAEMIQDKLITPMLNLSSHIKGRIPQRAKSINVLHDPKYVEYFCLLEKLRGRYISALWHYAFFAIAICRDFRITHSYKFWRLVSVLLMLLVPYRIYARAKEWYAKSNRFYELRREVFNDKRWN